MNKLLAVCIVLAVCLSGCFWNNSTGENVEISAVQSSDPTGSMEEYDAPAKGKTVFTQKENGNVISDSGVEYTSIANEETLTYLGETEFLGSVEGEEFSFEHLDFEIQTGMYALKHDKNHDILMRYYPDNEWFSIYRKTTLPALDCSVDNCARLEMLKGTPLYRDAVHTTCGDGVTDPQKIKAFFSDIRAQKTAKEAGLYDMVRKKNGELENCYEYGIIYGFFEEEPNVAIAMTVMSFDDLAYSVWIDDSEYVLPESWFRELKKP